MHRNHGSFYRARTFCWTAHLDPYFVHPADLADLAVVGRRAFTRLPLTLALGDKRTLAVVADLARTSFRSRGDNGGGQFVIVGGVDVEFIGHNRFTPILPGIVQLSKPRASLPAHLKQTITCCPLYQR